MKRLLIAILTLLILTSQVGAANAAGSKEYVFSDIGVVVNGKWIDFPVQPVVKNDRLLIPVRVVFESLGGKVDWYAESASFRITLGNNTVDMKIGDKYYKVNNDIKIMDVQPILLNGTSLIPLRFAAEGVGLEVNWQPEYSAVVLGDRLTGGISSRGSVARGFRVVIDAGHGGVESGAVYGGIEEKHLNLDIAQRLEKLLQAEGIQTFMTREDDSYVGLYKRSGLANSINADLLISIHNNAGSSATTGSMSLYYPGNSNSKGNLSTKEFAQIVQKHLSGELNTRNIGIIPRANLAVLRTSKMPAVIAEVAYMTNSSELKKLKTPEFRQKAAEALKNAVLEALIGI